MIDPLIIKSLSLVLGCLLLAAAWHKLTAIQTFVAVVEDYHLVPPVLSTAIARMLPPLEIGLGIAWILGLAMPLVAPATAALFALFTSAIAINLWRGRVHISCGCGLGSGSGGSQPLSWILVLRNLLLILACLLPLAGTSDRNLGMIDWLSMTAALLVSSLLYLGVSQLLENSASIRSWSNSR